MTIGHFPVSRSVIVDVLRAIVSRPIANKSMSPLVLTCRNNHDKLLLTNLKFKNQRFYSSISSDNPTLSDHSRSQKEKYHLLKTKDANGNTRKNVKGFTLKKKKEKPTTVLEYNRLILYVLKEGRLNKAIRLFREMESKQITPDIYSYTMIVNGFSKQSDIKRAKRWIQRMYANKISPDANVYSSLIDGYMREANIDKAESVFRLMMKKDIKPTLVTYNILMHHSVRKLNIESALKFWGKLLEAGLKSDVYTFAIILHGLATEGKVDEAWRIYNIMQKQKVDVNEVVATTLMNMHVKQHDNDHALELFEKFFNEKRNLKPTDHTRNVLLNAVISNADLETINSYYDQYIKSLDKKKSVSDDSPLFLGSSVYTHTTFMRAFLRKNDLLMVSKVYQDMISRSIQPTLVTYATMMLAHAYIPDPEACNRIFQELRNSKIELNAVIYTILMRAWAKAGRWENVKSTYDLMKQDNIKPTKVTMAVLRYGKYRIDP